MCGSAGSRPLGTRRDRPSATVASAVDEPSHLPGRGGPTNPGCYPKPGRDVSRSRFDDWGWCTCTLTSGSRSAPEAEGMIRGIEHDSQPAGVSARWLPWGLTRAERSCTPDGGFDITHANLEVHHLRLGGRVFGPNRWHIPVLGLNIEPHSALRSCSAAQRSSRSATSVPSRSR